jgi:transcription initiation factor TFIID subunit TAF12
MLTRTRQKKQAQKKQAQKKQAQKKQAQKKQVKNNGRACSSNYVFYFSCSVRMYRKKILKK